MILHRSPPECQFPERRCGRADGVHATEALQADRSAPMQVDADLRSWRGVHASRASVLPQRHCFHSAVFAPDANAVHEGLGPGRHGSLWPGVCALSHALLREIAVQLQRQPGASAHSSTVSKARMRRHPRPRTQPQARRLYLLLNAGKIGQPKIDPGNPIVDETGSSTRLGMSYLSLPLSFLPQALEEQSMVKSLIYLDEPISLYHYEPGSNTVFHHLYLYFCAICSRPS